MFSNLSRKFWSTFNAYFWLRLGLATTFFLIGYATILNPLAIRGEWLNQLPDYFDLLFNIFPTEVYLRLIGIIELVVAVLLGAWFLPKRTVFWAGLIGTIDILTLVLVFGFNFDSAFYIGILGAMIAISLFYNKRYSS